MPDPAKVFALEYREVEAEAKRLRAAIEQHREEWQEYNGTAPAGSLPSDLRLWAALDA